MKWVNPPVALMLHAGVPLLIDAGVHLPGLHAGDRARVALEGYPGLLARELIGRRSYKSDERAKQTPERLSRARADLVAALEPAAAGSGLRLQLEPAQRERWSPTPAATASTRCCACCRRPGPPAAGLRHASRCRSARRLDRQRLRSRRQALTIGLNGRHQHSAPRQAWFARQRLAAVRLPARGLGAMADGRSGLLHATTGSGKTYAVWLGALLRGAAHDRRRGQPAPPLGVLWLTPMRALAADTTRALAAPLLEALAPHWTLGQRTGDTPAAERARQDRRCRPRW